MDVNEQTITDDYALYCGDCLEVMPTLPDGSVHLSVYSPPFVTATGGLYNYSSSERDLSNSRTYDEFFVHYGYVVKELHRLTMPGRCSAVHCIDVPKNGANCGGLTDFPGDIIRLHESIGWEYAARYHIWKEPLGVRNRTMAKGLSHKQVVDDASLCSVASADYLLLFRRTGENPVPVTHPYGLMWYAGERQVPAELMRFRGHEGKQTENRYSHWIWRQYASAFWDDIRISRVLPYVESKEKDDERHVHPLQLDVIERTVVLRSNPGEVVLTPFMGVGSEVWGAVVNDRRGVGMELKNSYYQQAVRNLTDCKKRQTGSQPSLFADEDQFGNNDPEE